MRSQCPFVKSCVLGQNLFPLRLPNRSSVLAECVSHSRIPQRWRARRLPQRADCGGLNQPQQSQSQASSWCWTGVSPSSDQHVVRENLGPSGKSSSSLREPREGHSLLPARSALVPVHDCGSHLAPTRAVSLQTMPAHHGCHCSRVDKRGPPWMSPCRPFCARNFPPLDSLLRGTTLFSWKAAGAGIPIAYSRKLTGTLGP